MNSILSLALRGALPRAEAGRADWLGEARSVGDALDLSRKLLSEDQFALNWPVLSEAQADALGVDPSFGNFALDLADWAADALSDSAGAPGAALIAGFNLGALSADGVATSSDPFNFSEREALDSPVSRAAQILFAGLQAQFGDLPPERLSGGLVDDNALWAIFQRAQSPFLARRPLTLCLALGFAQGVLGAQSRVDATAHLGRALDRIHAASGFAGPKEPRAAASSKNSPEARQQAEPAPSVADGPAHAAAGEALDEAPGASEAPANSANSENGQSPDDFPRQETPASLAAGSEAIASARDLVMAARPEEPDATPGPEPVFSEGAAALEASLLGQTPASAAEFAAAPSGEPGARAENRPKRVARPRGPTRPPKSTKPKAKEDPTPASELSTAGAGLRLDQLRKERKARMKNKPRAQDAAPVGTPTAMAAANPSAGAEPSAEARGIAPGAIPAKKAPRLPARVAARARKASPHA